MAVSREDVLRWLSTLQKVFNENRQQLTDLDSAVGDGDFGISLDRGFTAVQAELTAKPPADIRAVFQSVATVLIKTMGGSSGPLLGTFFLRAAATCADKSELAATDVVALFQAGVEGLRIVANGFDVVHGGQFLNRAYEGGFPLPHPSSPAKAGYPVFQGRQR